MGAALALLLLASAMGYSGGTEEKLLPEPERLVLVIGTPDVAVGTYSQWTGQFVGPEFTKRTGIPVTVIDKGSLDGTTQKVDLLLASGEQVDVFHDYMGRTCKFANPRYAVNLSEYLPPSYFERFHPNLMAQFWQAPGYYALPDSGWAVGMSVNLTLLDRLGMRHFYERGSWSLEEFTHYLRAVRRLGPDYYGSMFFGKQSTGDYYLQSFLATFGARIFDEAGTLVADSPAMVAAFEYILGLQKEGLIVPGGAGLDDPEYKRRWLTGKLGAVPGVVTFAIDMPATSFATGAAEAEWQAAIMEMPKAPGVTQVPTIMGYDAACVFKSDRYGRSGAVELAQWLVDPEVQAPRVDWGKRFPSIPGAGLHDAPAWYEMARIVDRYGAMNVGLALPDYARIRELWYPKVQAILAEEQSPLEALQEFVRDARPWLSR